MELAKLINFLIFVGVLAYFFKTPLQSLLSDRHEQIRRALEKASTELKAAQKKLSEFSDRVQGLDSEIEELARHSQEEAERARVRILTEAKKMADQIIIDSKRAAEQMSQDLRKQIQTEFSNHVVARAEMILKGKLTGEDRSWLIKSFSDRVGSTSL